MCILGREDEQHDGTKLCLFNENIFIWLIYRKAGARARSIQYGDHGVCKEGALRPIHNMVWQNAGNSTLQFIILLVAWLGAFINEYRTGNPDYHRLMHELTNMQRIRRILFLAFGWPIAGFLGFIAARNIDPSFYSIVNAQSYVVTALLTKFGFGRSYTKSQWYNYMLNNINGQPTWGDA